MFSFYYIMYFINLIRQVKWHRNRSVNIGFFSETVRLPAISIYWGESRIWPTKKGMLLLEEEYPVMDLHLWGLLILFPLLMLLGVASLGSLSNVLSPLTFSCVHTCVSPGCCLLKDQCVLCRVVDNTCWFVRFLFSK